MWKAGGPLRRQAIEIIVIFFALLATVGAFGIWWGGAAAPSRPIVSGLAPAAAAHRRGVSCRTGGFGAPRRAAPAPLGQHRHRHHPGAVAGRPADQQRPRRHVGAARILVAAVGIVDARSDLHPPSVAHRAAAHGVVAGDRGDGGPRDGACRRHARGPVGTGRGGHARPGAGRDRRDAAVLAGRSAAAARRSQRAIAPHRARRLRHARQAGVDDLQPAAPRRRHRGRAAIDARRAAACSAPTSSRCASFTTAASRCRPAPTRSTSSFNERAAEQAWPLALQIGRVGPPLQSWTIQAQPGQLWSTTLWLPVSANFVGLRGPHRNGERHRRDHHHAHGRRRRRRHARSCRTVRLGGASTATSTCSSTTSACIRSRPASGCPAMRTAQITVAVPLGHTAPVVLAHSQRRQG